MQLIGHRQLDGVILRLGGESNPDTLIIEYRGREEARRIRLDRISDIEVKQSRVGFCRRGIIPLGPKTGPKVYELRFKARDERDGNISFRFVSHNVTCDGSDCSHCREGGDNGQEVRDLAEAIHSAIEEDSRQRAKPSSLVTTVQYDDSHSFLPDGRIDAGKKAELVISVENRGPGTAYQVVTSATTNQRPVIINGEQALGDIGPGQKREARLSIAADLHLADGEVTVSVDAREQHRDFKARRVDVIIQTAVLKPPQLSIENFTEINDGNTGLAQGNGNKVPENGEKFELLGFVHNGGTAPATGVVLSVVNLPPGIEPLIQSAEIGTVRPGETKNGKLAFQVSRTWSGSSLSLQLKAVDVRGESVGVAYRSFAIKAASHAPVLSASTRVLVHGNATTELINGQTAEIEVTPQNDGEIEADDVVLHISAPNLTFQPDQRDIGKIQPHEKQLPQRFQFSLPRGFVKDRLPVMIELSQKDFVPAHVPAELAVKHRLPDLRPKLAVLESSDPQTMEQDQIATLELELVNNGTLSAQDVTAQININNPGVKPLSPVEIKLGDIPPSGNAPARFKFHVGRSVSPGQLAVLVSVLQADFLPKTQTFQLQVRAEKVREVRIIPAPSGQGLTSRHLPPMVLVGNPHDGEHIRENSIHLVAVVSSDRYINNVEIVVREVPIAADRVQESLRRYREEQQGRYVAEVNMSIPLDFGANKIELVAYDQDNERGVKTITVNRDKAASLEELGTQRLEVVKLRSHPNDRSVETSAGIYVGKDKENAYFITAFHPLQKYADNVELVDAVELQFYTRPTLFPAKILNHFDSGEDLAVVYIPLSNLPVEAVPMTLKDASAELPIHIIGHPPGGDWTSWKGEVQNELAVGGNGHLFSTGTDQSLTKGFSGAPVFDVHGHLVGMHLKSSASFSMNLKIGVVLSNLKVWQVPINNLE